MKKKGNSLITRIARRVQPMEQELVTLLAHLGSPRDFSEVPVVHVVQLHVGILVCSYEKVNIYIYVQYSQMNSDM